MKIKCWRNIQNSLLFLSVGFLMFSNPFTGKAQNNSAINLSGTKWGIEPIAISTADSDNSVTKLTGYLIFRKQGIVEALIVREKSMGNESESVTEEKTREYISSSTGRVDFEKIPERVQRTVTTPPKVYAVAWKGTYEIRGKTVYIDFPTCTIEADISGGSIKGITTYKDSKKKETWIFSPSTPDQNNSSDGNTNSGSLPNADSSPNKINTVRPQKVLTQKIIDRFNPTKLTSGTISGNISDREPKKYFYFTAVPGELTVTLSLTAAPTSGTTAHVGFYDPNQETDTQLSDSGRLLGSVSTLTGYGRTETSVEKFRFSEKMPVLVELTTMNSGSGAGKFTIKLEGAYDTQSSEIKSSLDSGDKRQSVVTLLAKAKDLSRSQKKFRESVDALSTIIETELDTNQYIIEAYVERASIKLGQKDYNGVIEDCSRAIQLSTPLKKNVMEIIARENSISGDSRDPVVAAKAHYFLQEQKEKNPEVSAAMIGLQHGYFFRAVAKSKLGDITGACEDFRMFISLGSKYNGNESEFCK